ncbi:glycosyltransferase [Prosthecobacter vanneervenii]|uniref:Rhamnosyltransferase subunit B n=1 Tax=Prosthecobacter vanneervenii TaxID=48466 RepID=A0A7W8DLV2_9BACT|nr:nucleotide disphospho-sugar-binding domain-containing protein [Prosthecobacter vanneervenii]MBB5034759.1 rhamnosyltransferase subunit B [Prosthecobacter vanneervenii]
MAKIYLLPIGTTGDLLPMIWIGRQMKARGHEVVLFWLEEYRDMVREAGLDFGGYGEDDCEEPIRNAGYWKMHEGLRLSYDFAGRCAVMCINAVTKWMQSHGRPDLLMAPIMSFAAPILRSRLGAPLITTHMSTLQLLSAHKVPLGVPCGKLLRILPLPVRRALLHRVAPYDHLAKPHLRQCCTEPGEKPPRWLRDWFYSPDGSLVFFPAWYVPPQPDWPVNTYQWDFPMEDLVHSKKLEPGLAAFLDAGEAPVVFRFGSDATRSRPFYSVAAELVERISSRAVFVIRQGDQVPDNLPDTIHTTTYVPFSLLLPHVSVCVHYGGMGTLSQCFAAGLPQIIVPMVFDQFDNAHFVESLGAGLQLNLNRWSVANALPLLMRCLEDEGIRRSAKECAERLRQRKPVSELAEWLETKMKPASPASAAIV